MKKIIENTLYDLTAGRQGIKCYFVCAWADTIRGKKNNYTHFYNHQTHLLQQQAYSKI